MPVNIDYTRGSGRLPALAKTSKLSICAPIFSTKPRQLSGLFYCMILLKSLHVFYSKNALFHYKFELHIFKKLNYSFHPLGLE